MWQIDWVWLDITLGYLWHSPCLPQIKSGKNMIKTMPAKSICMCAFCVSLILFSKFLWTGNFYEKCFDLFKSGTIESEQIKNNKIYIYIYTYICLCEHIDLVYHKRLSLDILFISLDTIPSSCLSFFFFPISTAHLIIIDKYWIFVL